MTTKNPSSHLAESIFTVLILAAVLLISYSYILPLTWAALVVIACWPFYNWTNRVVFRRRNTLSALVMTILTAIIIITPISWLIINISQEIIAFSHTLNEYNKTGIAMPSWLHSLPILKNKAISFWQQNLSKPGFLVILSNHLNQNYSTITDFAQSFGTKTLEHSINLFFFILATFFFFKDGDFISKQLNIAGKNILVNRWQSYFNHLPEAIRSVVNGSIVTAIGVGILMGISYAMAGLFFPVLFGFITAVLAIIPFGMMLTVIIIIAILIIQSHFTAAIAIGIWGAIVAVLSDNVVKPALIGNSTKLPFLMILIGILGGAQHLGIIGLFLGPVIMILFYSLYEEFTQH